MTFRALGRRHLEPTTNSKCYSQGYVSIEQLDSPGRRQFQVGCSKMTGQPQPTGDQKGSPAAATEVTAEDRTSQQSSDLQLGPRHPALGANASPEVTHLVCRLPLVTSPHGPEVIHLGVLMRIRYGQREREKDLRWIFHEDYQGTERCKSCIAFSMGSDAFHQLSCNSRRQRGQREKRTLLGPGSPAVHRCQRPCGLSSPRAGAGILTCFPFPQCLENPEIT